MDHHRLNNAAYVVAGALLGGSAYGPLGAVAGAAISHGVNKHYDKRRENREEEEDFF
jgi:hypothetical protein